MLSPENLLHCGQCPLEHGFSLGISSLNIAHNRQGAKGMERRKMLWPQNFALARKSAPEDGVGVDQLSLHAVNVTQLRHCIKPRGDLGAESPPKRVHGVVQECFRFLISPLGLVCRCKNDRGFRHDRVLPSSRLVHKDLATFEKGVDKRKFAQSVSQR
jgi:hypothetical protein